MTGVLHAPATWAGLDAAIAGASGHLKPVLRAVRDYRVGFLFVGQGSDAFHVPDTPKRVGVVAIVGDDMEQSIGPAGFHLPSVRRLIRGAQSFAVVSCAPIPGAYAALTAAAVDGKTAVIVETRLEHEFAWVELIRKLAPRRPLLICTVRGGEA